MDKIYDALEICLQELERGADVESVLMRFPDLADELRPILEASMAAKSLSAPEPSADLVHRNRAKVLQHAAEMREAAISQPVKKFDWLALSRRLATSMAVLAFVLVSGTSLVGAAAISLPGDALYPVKRSWEGLQLSLAFSADVRTALEVEHANERLEEVRELLAGKQPVDVVFNGVVTRQGEGEWVVAGVRVTLSAQTDMQGQIALRSAVQVIGRTQADGSVLAQSVQLLTAEAPLPNVPEVAGDENSLNENESGTGAENEAPVVVVTSVPEADNANDAVSILDDEFWEVNGTTADLSNAEIIGTPSLGAIVIVEGYFNDEGVFIVTQIEFVADDDSNTNDNSNDNNNDNSNDNSNDNGNDNDNSGNDNSNDFGNNNDNSNGGSNDNGDDNDNDDNDNDDD